MARNLFVGSDEKEVLSNSRTFEERQEELELFDKLENERNQREKNSPYSRWSQFNLEHTKELMNLALSYPKAQAILFFLIDQMDQYNAVMCSYKVIEEVLEISKDTIRLSIKKLEELGFIAIYKSGSSNVYTINDSVAWKSWGKNRKYSKFPANVVLTKSEQFEMKLKKEKLTEVKVKSEK